MDKMVDYDINYKQNRNYAMLNVGILMCITGIIFSVQSFTPTLFNVIFNLIGGGIIGMAIARIITERQITREVTK